LLGFLFDSEEGDFTVLRDIGKHMRLLGVSEYARYASYVLLLSSADKEKVIARGYGKACIK
jgi:hypothetical protein